jgi:hypothetical protein
MREIRVIIIKAPIHEHTSSCTKINCGTGPILVVRSDEEGALMLYIAEDGMYIIIILYTHHIVV